MQALAPVKTSTNTEEEMSEDNFTFDEPGGMRQQEFRTQRVSALEEINEETTGIRAKDLPRVREFWED